MAQPTQQPSGTEPTGPQDPFEGMSSEEVLALMLSGELGGEEQEVEEFIGVPPDWRAEQMVQGPPVPERMAQGPPAPGEGFPTIPGEGFPTRMVAPQYEQGAQLNYFMSLPPDQRMRLQDDLRAAGLLQDPFRHGIFDRATANAISQVMAWANQTGSNFSTALKDFQTTKASDELKATAPKLYEAPDYATHAQDVKAWFRQNLGREPRDYEVKLLADELAGGFQQKIQQQYQAEQGVTDTTPVGTDRLGQAVNAEGEVIIPPEGGEQEGPQTTTAVDPKARFHEAMEERYSGEIATVELEEEAARTQQVASRGANLLRRMIGS